MTLSGQGSTSRTSRLLHLLIADFFRQTLFEYTEN